MVLRLILCFISLVSARPSPQLNIHYPNKKCCGGKVKVTKESDGLDLTAESADQCRDLGADDGSTCIHYNTETQEGLFSTAFGGAAQTLARCNSHGTSENWHTYFDGEADASEGGNAREEMDRPYVLLIPGLLGTTFFNTEDARREFTSHVTQNEFTPSGSNHDLTNHNCFLERKGAPTPPMWAGFSSDPAWFAGPATNPQWMNKWIGKREASPHHSEVLWTDFFRTTLVREAGSFSFPGPILA